MERKIGEIFEYEGEWYQCINTGNCSECAFTGKRCYDFSTKGVDIIGDCTGRTFKKLEKVGEPYEFDGHLFQSYHTFAVPIFTENYATVRELGNNSKISIEIKQIKEDMEETKLNIKPFSLEAAKAGKPVCTRDGRKARIICFDRVTNSTNEYTGHLIVLVTNPNGDEQSFYYTEKGNLAGEDEYDNHKWDLMMLPEKKEGWVNIVKTEDGGYCCKGEVHSDYNDAINENINVLDKRGITVKIEWYD